MIQEFFLAFIVAYSRKWFARLLLNVFRYFKYLKEHVRPLYKISFCLIEIPIKELCWIQFRTLLCLLFMEIKGKQFIPSSLAWKTKSLKLYFTAFI